MSLELLKFLYRETAGSKLRVTATSLVSGLSRGMLLAIINSAAAKEGVQPLDLLSFIATLLVYLGTTYDAMLSGRRLVETIAQRMRLRLVEKLVCGSLRFAENMGASELYTCIERDVGRLSGAAFTFVDGSHTIVLLVFALGYLGWLTPIGLLVVIIAIVLAVSIHFKQDAAATRDLEQARAKATIFYHGIDDVLHGFKELKQTRARHTELMTHLTTSSDDFQRLTLRADATFFLSSLTSALFMFLLMGVLVFVVPLQGEVNRTVIFQLLASILFIVGPVESLISALSSLAVARVALHNLQRLENSLASAIADVVDDGQAVASFHCIILEKLRFRFTGDSAEERFEVGPINLELRSGEVLFIVGGNGSGKTTLLKLLTGLYAPDSGRLLVDDEPVDPARPQAYRELFAAVFGDFHLFRKLHGITVADDGRVDDLLAQLQLDHKTKLVNGEFLTTQLSTGQRKRLAYAVARLLDRQVYVFDEFAADQDPTFRDFFYYELLPELQRQGKTIVAITHDDRYFDVADRVIKMVDGRIANVAIKASSVGAVRSTAP